MTAIVIVCSLIGATAIGAIVRRWLRNREDEHDPTQWIVIVELSMFRETIVLGPYRKNEAEDVQQRETRKHPFCMSWRCEADCRVMQGDRVLWPKPSHTTD